MQRFTHADIPPQRGRSAVVTGTGGLGFETALALARAGCAVTLAGRDPAKGARSVAAIEQAHPESRVDFEQVDLADLRSVADFSDRLRARRRSLDLLVNNAGIMVPPTREVTRDGFELQLQTNYLGHFALTAGLMPLLRAGNRPRVVTLSSVAARDSTIDFDDLQTERNYQPMGAYRQSKLACLMFALELQRRSEARGWGITSLAAHPGIARTSLLHNAQGRWSASGVARTVLWFLFQPAAQGALPTLYAATSSDAEPGGYYGPHRLRETRGYPAPAAITPPATDLAVRERLWEVSEALTGTSFDGARPIDG